MTPRSPSDAGHFQFSRLSRIDDSLVTHMHEDGFTQDKRPQRPQIDNVCETALKSDMALGDSRGIDLYDAAGVNPASENSLR
jgi:hypothetical protein